MNFFNAMLPNIFKLCLVLLLMFSYYMHSHAHILEGFKDAILTAEGVMGDIFRSFDSMAKHIKFSKEAFEDSIEEECVFICPNGIAPKKNKYHIPHSNGCGPLGMQIDSQYLPMYDMTKCCDQHDICYGTCNKDKDECDLNFKKCLYKICDKSKTKMTETFSTGCKAAAKVLYSGTMMFGCKFYKSAQQEACYCPPSQKFTGDEF